MEHEKERKRKTKDRKKHTDPPVFQSCFCSFFPRTTIIDRLNCCFVKSLSILFTFLFQFNSIFTRTGLKMIRMNFNFTFVLFSCDIYFMWSGLFQILPYTGLMVLKYNWILLQNSNWNRQFINGKDFLVLFVLSRFFSMAEMVDPCCISSSPSSSMAVQLTKPDRNNNTTANIDDGSTLINHIRWSSRKVVFVWFSSRNDLTHGTVW